MDQRFSWEEYPVEDRTQGKWDGDDECKVRVLRGKDEPYEIKSKQRRGRHGWDETEEGIVDEEGLHTERSQATLLKASSDPCGSDRC